MSDAQTSLRYVVVFMPKWVFSCKVWLLCLETRLKEKPAVRSKWKQSGELLERIGAMGAQGTRWCCAASLGHLGKVTGVLVHLITYLQKAQRIVQSGQSHLSAGNCHGSGPFGMPFLCETCEGMWLGAVNMDLLTVSCVWCTSLSSVIK